MPRVKSCLLFSKLVFPKALGPWKTCLACHLLTLKDQFSAVILEIADTEIYGI